MPFLMNVLLTLGALVLWVGPFGLGTIEGDEDKKE